MSNFRIFKKNLPYKGKYKRKKKITEINNKRKGKDVVEKIYKKAEKERMVKRKKKPNKKKKDGNKEKKWTVSRNRVIISQQHE